MVAVLATAGAVAILAAVLGGGLSAFDMQVPVIDSRARQALLGVVGLAFVGTAWLLNGRSADGGVGTYRETAKASCERMVATTNRALGPGVQESLRENTFDKAALVSDLRGRISTLDAELDVLLERPVPKSLTDEHAAARRLTDQWLTTFRARVDAVAALPNTVVSQAELEAAVVQSDDAAVRIRVNDAMTALAGTNCAIAGV